MEIVYFVPCQINFTVVQVIFLRESKIGNLCNEINFISDHHKRLRQEVVQYMRNHREDFEPFHDENDPFDHHLELLQEDGTYAGNDVLVAFSRSHNVTIGKNYVKSCVTFLNVLNFIEIPKSEFKAFKDEKKAVFETQNMLHLISRKFKLSEFAHCELFTFYLSYSFCSYTSTE